LTTVGDVIKNLRKSRDLSQAQLARESDVELGTLQGYEQNRFIPTLHKVSQIERALHVPYGTIIRKLLKEKNHGKTKHEKRKKK
jgi:transcriptional regulator with XRE-family HTH domain